MVLRLIEAMAVTATANQMHNQHEPLSNWLHFEKFQIQFLINKIQTFFLDFEKKTSRNSPAIDFVQTDSVFSSTIFYFDNTFTQKKYLSLE